MLTLNIGLGVAEGKTLHPLVALDAVRRFVGIPVKHAVHQSDTEQTLVVSVGPVLDARRRVHALAEALAQDAIAVASSMSRRADDVSGGDVIGPRAAAWGGFNPQCFLTLDGRRLSDVLQAAA
jgi:hypothetical protein